MRQHHLLTTTFSLVVALSLHLASANWKAAKDSHHNAAPPLDGVTMKYFANDLKNERDFKSHLDQILIPRVSGTPGSETVRQYISQTLKGLGWDVEISSSNQPTPLGSKDFHNIVATLDPEAPRRLVLACHYDSKLTPTGFLGATDSAVPCAQMLNLATTMRMSFRDYNKLGKDLTVQLIFFDGEEAFVEWQGNDNTYGARDLANKWHQRGYSFDQINGNYLDRIDVFVLLDLIGAADPTFVALKRETVPWFQRLVRIERALHNDLAFKGRRSQWMFADARQRAFFNGGVEDDHIHFERKGVPILHLICFPFPSVWHKLSDNESAIDYASVEDLNKIFRVFVAEYLQLEQ